MNISTRRTAFVAMLLSAFTLTGCAKLPVMSADSPHTWTNFEMQSLRTNGGFWFAGGTSSSVGCQLVVRHKIDAVEFNDACNKALTARSFSKNANGKPIVFMAYD